MTDEINVPKASGSSPVNGDLVDAVNAAAAEVRGLRKSVRRSRVANVVLWIVTAAVVVLSYFGWDNYRDDKAQDCRTSLLVRVEQKSLLVGVARDLGADSETIDGIQHFYDNLPEPTGC